MKVKFWSFLAVGFFLMASIAHAQETIWLNLRGVIERPAEFYSVNSKIGAVLAPQFLKNAASWKPIAEQLKSKNVTSIALNGSNVEEVVAAIAYLKNQGVKRIALIGASMGGGAILEALQINDIPEVTSAVLLGTAFADASKVHDVPKLFVNTTEDHLAEAAYKSFNFASQPKILVELPGREHAQEIFEGAHKDAALTAIFDFLDATLINTRDDQ